MTRRDHEQRPARERTILGIRWRSLDLVGPDGKTFLRRRGLDAGAFGIYLHRLDGPDPGLDLHDHPWPFAAIVLRGGYDEEVAEAREAFFYARLCAVHPTCSPGWPRSWGRGSVHRMPYNIAHRITAVRPGTVTLVFRFRKRREWGFYQPGGWVRWTDYDYDSRRPLTVESTHPEEHRPAGSTIPNAID